MQTTFIVMIVIMLLILIVHFAMTQLVLATIEMILKRIERWVTDIRDAVKDMRKDG